jgi:upstream activation factor subunit UAF30
MPKAKKTETTTVAAAEMPVEVVSDKTTSKSTKAKAEKTTTPKTTKSKTPEVDVVLTKTDTPVESTEATDMSTMTEGFTEFLSKLQALTTQIASLKTEFRALEKRSVRELKAAQKANAKRKRKSTNRAPSGFVKPTLISNELAGFLNKPVGTEMARTEVTREINGYIREHNLQDKENGRKINPDKKLASLLKIKSGDELTYFNLQRYMSPHFAKSQKALAEASGATTA